MNQYHKIHSIYKRDSNTKFKTFLTGQYSIPEFEYLKDNEWVWTEKVDGTNIRVIYNGNDNEITPQMEVTFKGKTDKAELPKHLLEKLKILFPQSKFLGKTSMTLYGEGYGYKIQKGDKYIGNQQVDFVLFDIKVGNWWLKREDVEKIAKELNIAIVPIIGKGTLQEAIEYTKKGFKSQWGDFIAEGLVLRPAVELKARNGERIITKIKYKDFNNVT